MRSLLLTLLVLLFAGASPQAPTVTHALDLSARDTSCAPCADFNRYASGAWMKRARIPAAYSAWGNWEELQDRTILVLRRIVEDAGRAPSGLAVSNRGKLGVYYGACMDSARIEAAGAGPLQPMLGRISAARTPADVEGLVGVLHRQGIGALFGFGATEDARQSGQVIAGAGQGGMGLPDRDYYLKSDDRSVQLRSAYRAHVARMLALAGESAADASTDATRIMALETQLAQASMTRVQRRDPQATYHKMSLAEVQALTPHFNWSGYLATVGAPPIGAVDVSQPDFLRAVDGLLVSSPIEDWQAYLRWRVIHGAAAALSSAFVEEDFQYSRQFTGATEILPRWKRCLGSTNAALSEVLGQEYVRRNFTAEAKARAVKMVIDLRAALGERIGALEWMSDATKQQALRKLTVLRTKIGYPDVWQDYSALEVTAGPFVENRWRAAAWAVARDLETIGKPVDRARWAIPPQTVDAWALNTEVVFPAGILQPPFFDPAVDDALNYGAMGAVIGHELTHHFDDQGRQFDADGNLRDWWTAADAASYDARAQRVVSQFDGYTVVDSATHVNGRLTLGENIADLGGLKIAYEALEKALTGRPRRTIDGYTPEQRFFLAYARTWRNVARPEYLRTRVNTDPHAPLEWRVNGPLSNLPEFAKAFGCKAGDPMVRPADRRALIW